MKIDLRVLCVAGTRPEAIKMAPVLKALRAKSSCETHLLITAQHREMLDEVLELFDLRPDYDLNVMRPGQSPGHVVASVVRGLERTLRSFSPHWVVVQGDTTTAFGAALGAFYGKVPVAHVEAGLRTGDLADPFPEEANRMLISRLAAMHFAPTDRAARNLREEGVPGARVLVTGNTVVDALQLIVRSRSADAPPLVPGAKIIVVTTHRRESFGPRLENICGGIARAATELRGEVEFVVLVHPNPRVEATIRKKLRGIAGVRLTSPLPYPTFIELLRSAYCVLTDSGGIQEEAPSLGVPVLILRDRTERPELVESGGGKLIGTDAVAVSEAVTNLVRQPESHRVMSRAPNPFGDGKAAERIADRLLGEAVVPFRGAHEPGGSSSSTSPLVQA